MSLRSDAYFFWRSVPLQKRGLSVRRNLHKRSQFGDHLHLARASHSRQSDHQRKANHIQNRICL